MTGLDRNVSIEINFGLQKTRGSSQVRNDYIINLAGGYIQFLKGESVYLLAVPLKELILALYVILLTAL